MHFIATFNGGCLQNYSKNWPDQPKYHYREMEWLPFQKNVLLTTRYKNPIILMCL